MMTGKHRLTRRQTCPNATFGYQVRVKLRRTDGKSVGPPWCRGPPWPDMLLCQARNAPSDTVYIQFIPHREHNFHSKSQSVKAAHRNHHCLISGIRRKTKTHCVGKTLRWTPVICGTEFPTYFEDVECRCVSSAFRRGINEILALL